MCSPNRNTNVLNHQYWVHALGVTLLLVAGTSPLHAQSGPSVQNASPCPVGVYINGTGGFPAGGYHITLEAGALFDIGEANYGVNGQIWYGTATINVNGVNVASVTASRSSDGICNTLVPIDGCQGSSPINDTQARQGCQSDCCTGNAGMPRWSVDEPYLSIFLRDRPLWYEPAFGPEVSLDLAYKHREFVTGTDASVFSFGRGWNNAWLSFVNLDTNSNNVVLLPSGGQMTFTGTTNYLTNTRLTGDTTNGFTLTYPDGSTRIYGQIITNSSGTFLEAFMTESRDPDGRAVKFAYQGYSPSAPVIRLSSVTDAEGGVTSLTYNSTNLFSTNLVFQVTDRYGRTATFLYDRHGCLTNISDVLQIATTIAYDTNYLVSSMTTPYGTTAFAMTETHAGATAPNGRSVLVTLPDNSHELFLYTNGAPGISASYSSSLVPTNPPYSSSFENSTLDQRNTFHWGRLQYGSLSTTTISSFTAADFAKAHMKHWLLSAPGTVSETLSLERLPSPDSAGSVAGQLIWYDYTGKTNNSYTGTQSLPLFVSQVLPDGSTHFVRNERNGTGLPTASIETYTSFGGIGLRTNSFTYDSNDIDLLRATNALGIQVITNSWNANHQILTSFDALNEKTTFTYNSNKQLSSIIFPNGLITTNLYFSSGAASNRLDRTIDYEPSQTYRSNLYTWTNGLVYSHTDPLGLTTVNTWDALQRLRRVDYPDGTYVTNTYLNLDLVQVRDRMGFSNSFGYNSVRQLVAATNANGAVTRYGYCSCGSLNAVTNAFGTPIQAITTYSWDLQGHLLQTVGPDLYTVTKNYNALGQVTNITDGLMSTTNWYNNQGLQMASSNAFGQVAAAIYDTLDRATNTVDGNAVTTTNTFDNLDRLLTRGYPDGGVERFVYAFGTNSPISYTNQLGTNVVNFTYDSLARKTLEVYPGLRTNVFSYDAANNLLTLTDGKSQVTAWNYDQYGRSTNKVDAAGNVIFICQYDADNRLTNRWTPAKLGTTYSYDPVGNLTNVVYAVSPSISLAYDPLNRLTNMTDAVGTTRYTYTGAGLLLTEDGPWNDDTITYNYNSMRLRTSLSLQAPNASPWAESYVYDSAERLSGVTSPAGTFSYLYDSTRHLQVSSIDLPNSAYITNSFNSVSRLLSTILKNNTNGVLNAHSYAYNLDGQRTFLTNIAGDYRNYVYDNIGQLISANGFEANGTNRLQEQLSYVYDSSGNLNFKTNNGFWQNLTVNNLNELSTVTRAATNFTVAGTTTSAATNVTLSSTANPGTAAANLYNDNTFSLGGFGIVNGINTFTAIAQDLQGRRDTNSISVNWPATNAFTYDLNGNLLSDGSRSFTYDDENQLISVVVSNTLDVSTRSDFIYDGKMRRRVRIEYSWVNSSWATNQVVRYVYDRHTVVQERNFNNQPAVTYTRGLDLNKTLETAGGIGGLLARTDNTLLGASNVNAHAYYHADSLGNITCLIGSSQNILASYIYDPFGNELSRRGPLADANLLRSSSKELHPNSRLVYYLLRFFDPGLQRWLNRDPSGERGSGINQFTFVFNCPNRFIDPWGLQQQLQPIPDPIPPIQIYEPPNNVVALPEAAAVAEEISLATMATVGGIVVGGALDAYLLYKDGSLIYQTHQLEQANEQSLRTIQAMEEHLQELRNARFIEVPSDQVEAYGGVSVDEILEQTGPGKWVCACKCDRCEQGNNNGNVFGFGVGNTMKAAHDAAEANARAAAPQGSYTRHCRSKCTKLQ